MSFGKSGDTQSSSPGVDSPKPAAPRWAHWIRGAVLALCVAVANVIYYLWTGESLPSPRYGAATRHGHESNPGGAIALTGAMLLLALFFYGMHRRQVRLKREANKLS